MTDLDPTAGGSSTGSLLPVVDDDRQHPAEDRRTKDGIALCLSGGGYRAMLFHLGGIIRLNELGELRGLARVSSVSGGSITAGMLGLAWKRLTWDSNSVATNLDEQVIAPIYDMAGHTIDAGSIIGGILNPFRSITQKVARAYDEHLYDGADLQDLPAAGEGPRFVINATNVQTGKLFRFSQPYEGDWTIGLWRNPRTRLSDAVTASSAFPPVLSPHVIKPSGRLDPATTGPNSGKAFTDEIWLSDGGVYDNLGLETAFKQYRTILVSDGGGALGTDPKPKRDWARHGIRIAGIVDGQVRALRKRQIIGLYGNGFRDGTYWGVRSDVDDFGLENPIAIPDADRDAARSVTTRLAELDTGTRDDLVNWGYVIADTALRRWVFSAAAPPTGLPR